MIDFPYFRPGVGCVIYKDNYEVLAFRRSDRPEIWQFPQGGMDLDEDVTETLWRELEEETGLEQNDFSDVTKYPKWTVYEYPKSISEDLKYKNTLGQVHTWFFLKLKDGVEISLDKAVDKEFTDWKWLPFEELLANVNDFKRAVYQELSAHYSQILTNEKD